MIYGISLIFGGLLVLYLMSTYSGRHRDHLNHASISPSDNDRQAVNSFLCLMQISVKG